MPSRGLALFCALITFAIVSSPASAAPKKVAFKFSATTYSVPENAGTFNVTVMRSGNTSAAASIAFSDNGTGTAAGGGTDYSFTGGTLNFAAGQTSRTFPVTITDNGTANAPNKTIVLRLANATPAGSQIKTPTTALTIIDNEGPGTLDFSAGSYTVLEGAGAASVTVNRIGASNLKLSVDYATQAAAVDPASATSDYSPITPARTLTFDPGQMSKTFQVAIADDSDAEGPENVALLLSNPKNLTAGAAPQIGPSAPAHLTINDDDVSTFAFSAPSYSVAEEAGHAMITVTRSGATNIAGSVAYATANGTATGADYTSASGTLAFAPGETGKTFDVDVLHDDLDEANETVTLTLTSGGQPVGTSLLSIVDDDNLKASVQLSSPVYDVDESGGTVSVTVNLSHAVGSDVTVNYATGNVDDTATAGSDYSTTNGPLTFLAGQTSKTVEIPILQDPDAEDPETLTFALSGALPGASSVLGAPATATITIADDDPSGAIDFKSLHYDANETAGLATVTVERLGGVGGAVSVDYQTSDGSATAGTDYATAGGTLSWAAGDRGDKTFTVPISWDGRAEGTESISLTLTNLGGADAGPNSAALIRIGDDGASGPLALGANAYRTGEADGVLTVDVMRSGGSLGGPVSVDYATSDGTATAGTDYEEATGTLTFGPGEASKSVTVHVTSDAAHEGDETLQLKLSNATGGASLGSPAGATVTIADDDAAPISADPPLAGSGPASGPGQVPLPVLADKTAPKLTVTAKKVQRALKAKRFALKARCNEGCKLAVVAKVRIGKRTVTLGRVKLTARSGTTAKLKVKLSRKALGKLRKATRGGKAKVVLSVRATDAAGNRAAASRKVAVKR